MCENEIFKCDFIDQKINELLGEELTLELKQRIFHENPTFFEEIIKRILLEEELFFTLIMNEKFVGNDTKVKYIQSLAKMIKSGKMKLVFDESNRKLNAGRKNEVFSKVMSDLWNEIEGINKDDKIFFHYFIENQKDFMKLIRQKYDKMKLEEFIQYIDANNITFCVLIYLENYEKYTKHLGMFSTVLSNKIVSTFNLTKDNIKYFYELSYSLGLKSNIKEIKIRNENLDETYLVVEELFEESKITKEDFSHFISNNPVERGMFKYPELIKNSAVTKYRRFSPRALNSIIESLSYENVIKFNIDDPRRSPDRSNWIFYNNVLNEKQMNKITSRLKDINDERVSNGMMPIKTAFHFGYEFEQIIINENEREVSLKVPLDVCFQTKEIDGKKIISLETKSLQQKFDFYIESKVISIEEILKGKDAMTDGFLISLLLSDVDDKDKFNALFDFIGLTSSDIKWINLYNGFSSKQKVIINNKFKMNNIFQ